MTSAQLAAGKAYKPRGAVQQLFACRDSEILLEGPAGTGKTLGVLEKINACLLKYPGARALICRKTRKSMTESVLVTYERHVIPDNTDVYPDVRSSQRRVRQSYEYPNGSSLVVGGLDDPSRIMSTEFDLVAVFEATEATENDWEMLLTRLRNNVLPYQQAIADCNPGPPSHWLNQRANKGMMTRLLSRHEDNPTLYRNGVPTPQGKAYLSKLDRLTGHRLLRLRGGKWSAAEGLVYDNFDAAIHIIDDFDVPLQWRRIRSIDFGYTNPFTCQWWAIDNDGRMYLYREIYFTRRLVEDHARQIESLSVGERIEATVADHDAEDRATLSRYGIDTIPAYKAIRPGIEAVHSRLDKAGDGKPRLFIMRGALVERDESLGRLPACLSEEEESYSYPPGKDGKSPDEEPLDKDNHGEDAKRYAVAYVDDLASQKVEVQEGDQPEAVF